VNATKNLILDMDGVLWRGDTPMPGLAELFAALRQHRLPFLLVTNNSTRSTSYLLDKLERFGVRVPAEAILSSAEATASYLRREHPEALTAYLVGEEGLQQALAEQGFETVTPEEVRSGATADLVVGGLTRNLSYELVAMASLLVRRGTPFFATNMDASFPSEIGQLPGAGAVLSVITTTTGVSPVTIGKPEPIMFREALRRLAAEASVTAMVGDRLDTDIAGARVSGLRTILVLSGVTSRRDLVASHLQPDLVVEDIRWLTQYLDGRHLDGCG